MSDSIFFAFSLPLLAGLATGIGSLIGFLSKELNTNMLTISFGFSAGVMLYVSMIEILRQGKRMRSRLSLATRPDIFGR